MLKTTLMAVALVALPGLALAQGRTGHAGFAGPRTGFARTPAARVGHAAGPVAGYRHEEGDEHHGRVGVYLGYPYGYWGSWGLGCSWPYYDYAWGPGWGWGGPHDYVDQVTGKVKFEHAPKDASVYVDGSYAGSIHDTSSIRLEPGGYRVEVREGDRPLFNEEVYVSAGHTVHARVDTGAVH
jgi:hypothetical protein